MRREIVFTAYNRPDYLSQVVESWNNVRNLNFWNASFFIEPSDINSVIGDIAMKLETTVTVNFNAEKNGVLVNPWVALNTAFEGGADFVVLAEDDVVVSQDILEFFEWTSEEYSAAKKVLAVNAYSNNGAGQANQIFQETRFSPLVWGIWRDRWEEHLRDTWDKDYSSGNPDGSEAGWDWNINRILVEKGMTILKPLQSRSDHIGEFMGTHMTPDLFPESRGYGYEQIRGRQRYIEV